MSNLPQWKAASAVYSKAYAMLARMGSGGHVTRQRRQCVVSEDMRELIDALNRGHEERIKGLLMYYGARGF